MLNSSVEGAGGTLQEDSSCFSGSFVLSFFSSCSFCIASTGTVSHHCTQHSQSPRKLIASVSTWWSPHTLWPCWCGPYVPQGAHHPANKQAPSACLGGCFCLPDDLELILGGNGMKELHHPVGPNTPLQEICIPALGSQPPFLPCCTFLRFSPSALGYSLEQG